MSDQVFVFNKSLKIGDLGEKDFCSYYKSLLPLKSTEDLRFDFTVKNGLTVELKTDDYSMKATPNFFMELYSDSKTKKLGGPWRAKRDGIDLFVYYFLNDKTFFWFNPVTLCERLDSIIVEQNLTTCEVFNEGYIAEGYKIRRDDVRDLLLRENSFPLTTPRINLYNLYKLYKK